MDPAVPDNELWCAPPECLALKAQEIHVWRFWLTQEQRTVESLLETLSADERVRANKFHFRQGFEHFVIARGALRDILSLYTDLPPREIAFHYDQYGKPRLRSDDTRLCFNLSHSNGVALYAVSRGHAVGIDVEFVQGDFPGDEVAKHFFSAAEVASLQAVPAEFRTVAFFNCWTRKEAYIKALGEGLSHPLDRFTVSLVPGEPVRLLVTDDPTESSRWMLMDLPIGRGYVASLAVEGKVARVRHWQWDENTRVNRETLAFGRGAKGE